VYLPDALVGRRWYRPSAHGNERGIGDTMQRREDETTTDDG